MNHQICFLLVSLLTINAQSIVKGKFFFLIKKKFKKIKLKFSAIRFQFAIQEFRFFFAY